MNKTYYCISMNEEDTLSEWPKHEELKDAEAELGRNVLSTQWHIFKVTIKVEELSKNA